MGSHIAVRVNGSIKSHELRLTTPVSRLKHAGNAPIPSTQRCGKDASAMANRRRRRSKDPHVLFGSVAGRTASLSERWV